MAYLTITRHLLHLLEPDYYSMRRLLIITLGNWLMVRLPGLRALLVCGMLYSIQSQYTNCRHRWISSNSCTSYQDNFKGLSSLINQRHFQCPSRTQDCCFLSFVWWRYAKSNQTNHNTSQLFHSFTTIFWDITHSIFPSIYISIKINSAFNSCYISPWNSSGGGLRHCVSSECVSSITITASKNLSFCHHQTGVTSSEQEITIRNEFPYCTIISPPQSV